MTSYFIVFLLYTCVCCAGFAYTDRKIRQENHTQPPKWALGAVLLGAFCIRRYFGLQNVAFWYDVECFKSWADATAYYGLNGMYHSGMFLDYPPGYMYVLWLTNIIQGVFGLDFHSVVYTFIIKLPPILADLAGTVLIYKMAEKMGHKEKSLLLAACYAFCPALVYNSSVWGQIDSWYTLLMVLALYFIYEDDEVKAAVVYAFALITKPQALLFGPVLLFWVISKKDIRVFFRAVGTGLGCMWLLALPFSQSLSPLWLVNLYRNTFNGYRYFTVNGYNLYMLMGLNWRGFDSVPGATSINLIVILGCFVFCGWSWFNRRDKSKIFTTALVFITVFFSFCTMMHERYMHPAIILALISYICTKNKGYLGLFLSAAAANYFNVVASFVSQYNGVEITKPVYSFVSLLAIATAVGAVYMQYIPAAKDKRIVLSEKVKKYAAIGILCAVYAFVAFFRLGANTAPQSFYQSGKAGEWFVYRFEQPAYVGRIWSFSGMGDQYYPAGDTRIKKGCEFEILALNDSGLWENMANLHHDYVFTWEKVDTGFKADGVMIRAKDVNQVLSEIVFIDNENNIIRGEIESWADNVSGQYSPYNALDESHLIPSTEDDYFWSMYFDEIYHGRTAYEQLNSYTIYETTHPPLGKTIISIGIALFGMTPFGWRCMGALRGVAMVLLMYLMAKELFGDEKVALITAFVFAFDFMHYTQTRIATVDSYVVLFVMLMFLFMIRWAKIPMGANRGGSMFCLFMSGLFMGCAVATKWNGAYSAVGLAVYFFITLWQKYKAYSADKAHTDGIKKAVYICMWCVVCFVLLPCAVYFAAFGPVLYTEGAKQTFIAFINKQIHMFSYHSQLVAEHFFSSPWYTWPVIIKPIWYSVTRWGNMVSSISAFGNPAVWLPMVPALVYMTVKSIRAKDGSSVPVLAGYLASFLPWIAVTRLAFIYHYFPATVFGILAIGYVVRDVLKTEKGKKYIWVYPLTVLVLFVVFFPVISGFPTTAAYADSLELLNSWYFN